MNVNLFGIEMTLFLHELELDSEVSRKDEVIAVMQLMKFHFHKSY